MSNITFDVFLCGLYSQFNTLCRGCRQLLDSSHFHVTDRFYTFTVAKMLGLGLPKLSDEAEVPRSH